MTVKAESIPAADNLLKLTLDVGSETRQVFAAIRSAYSPEELIGRLPIIDNINYIRKMRYEISEGMIFAAGTTEQEIVF